MTYQLPYAARSTCPNRPVRRPSEAEARLYWARQVCRSLWGVDESKVARVLHLPLMDVALDGLAGMDIAQARDWRWVA